jgi:ubiquitin-like 1-activating enzyme E1 B
MVTAYNSSIYSKEFNDKFYEQFDFIISALDNMKVREYLAAQATRNNKPFIDAGTMSYNGQAYTTIRFKTNCHNCNPSRIG